MLFQVLRLHHSPYFSHDFCKKEKLIIEKLQPFKYCLDLEEINLHYPIILITNTHFQPSMIPGKYWEQIVLIIHPNSGFDNFPLAFLKEFSRPIILGNEIRSNAVAEYILSSLFHHLIPLIDQQSWDKNRKWDRPLLREIKILQLGLGHVGKVLQQTLSTLVPKENYQIIDPFLFPHNKIEKFVADAILVCADLNPTSLELINYSFLEQYASEKVVLINAARGTIVHEPDLVHFLKLHPQSHAYLDVFAEEPNNFLHFETVKKQVTKTSHMAGVFKTIEQNTLNFIEKILRDFVQFNTTPKEFLQQYQIINLHNILKIRKNFAAVYSRES